MKKLLLVLLFIPSLAYADIGFFLKADCNTIPSPVINSTWCFNTVSGDIFVWNGSTYELVAPTVGAGGVVDAEYLTGGAHAGLTSERIITSTPTVVWDLGTPGQARANVPDNAVTLSKLAAIATSTLLGRITAGSGNPEALTPAQVTSMLDIFTSALKGLVPSSGGGTANFLRADGTWAIPPAGGGGAPVEAEYIVSSIHAGLSAERLLTDTSTVIWDFSTAGQAKANVVSSAVKFLTLTPPTITSDQNNYAPTGGTTSKFWRLASDISRSISGIANGADGEERILINIGSSDIFLLNESAASAVGNRFITGITADLIVAPNAMITLLYDSVSQRWRMK